MYMPFSLFF